MHASLRSSGPSPVRVGFMMDQVALGQAFLPVLQFPLSVSLHQRSTLILIYDAYSDSKYRFAVKKIA